MQNFIIMIMEKAGYFGVCFLIALENIFPPIPSELILTFGGFMTTQTGLNLVLMIISATIGSLIGAIVLYYCGRAMGIEKIEALVSRRGKLLGLKPDDIRKANDWYAKHQKKTVFFCRMVPLLRSLISVPAGIAGMNFSGFVILTAAGSLIWNTVLIFLGSLLGEAWPKITEYMRIYSHITYIILGALATIIILFIIIRKKRKKKESRLEKN